MFRPPQLPHLSTLDTSRFAGHPTSKFCLLLILLVGLATALAGPDGPPAKAAGTPLLTLNNGDGDYPLLFDDWLVFSRLDKNLGKRDANEDGILDPDACCAAFHDVVPLGLWNTGDAPLTVQQLTVQHVKPALPEAYSNTWKISNTVTLPAIIAPGEALTLTLQFTAKNLPDSVKRFAQYGSLTIVSDAANTPTKVVTLAGAWQSGGENDEPGPGVLVGMFGYTTRLEYPGQKLQGFHFGYGEEVYSGRWKRANKQLPIYVRQMAAYHGCCAQVQEETFTLGGYGSFKHDNIDSQTVLPRLAVSEGMSPTVPAARLFCVNSAGNVQSSCFDTPSTIRVGSHPSDDGTGGNQQLRGVRFWPLRDTAGVLVPNTYIIIQDYVRAGAATNFDYQDNVYVVTNIRPTDAFVPDPYRSPADPSIPGLFAGAPGLNLEFDQPYINTLVDLKGLGIGFPDVQINRTDSPTVTSSYLPANLLLDPLAGTLTITTTNSSNSGSQSNRNNLVNGVRLPFDARHAPWVVGTRIKGLNGLTTAFQQGGLMIGPDQDNYIKLVALQSTSGPVVEFFGEIDLVNSSASPATVGQIALPQGAANVEFLDLRLLGDPHSGTVQAAFDIKYLGDPQIFTREFTTTIPLSGEDYYRFFDRRAKAGLLAIGTPRSGQPVPPAIPIVFDRFTITPGVSVDTEPLIARIDTGTSASRPAATGWTPDTGSGATGVVTVTSATGNFRDEPVGSGYSATVQISNTAEAGVDPAVYRTYRGNTGTSGNSPPLSGRVMTYTINVGTNRVVDVLLHFAELYHGLPDMGSTSGPFGERVFDVYAEGQPVLEDFDPAAAAGAARSAIRVPIKTIGVPDGELTLTFHTKKDYAAIAGIEVFESPAVPVANAGPDKVADINTTVTLDGRASTNPVSGATFYSWTQSGEPQVSLSCSQDGALCSFTAPPAAATLNFTLQISNTAGQISTPDAAKVTVQNTPLSNLQAGPDRVVTLGQPVSLTATVSGPHAEFSWGMGDGSEVITGASVTYSYTQTGVYTAAVTADNGRNQLVDEVVITVQNQHPLANAGDDRLWEVGSTVQLNGSASSDPDGHTPLQYAWAQLSGPNVNLICSGASCSFPAPNTPAGPWSFSLTVTDSYGLTGTDTISVSVGDIPPTGLVAANSGPTVLGQATTLSASLLAGSNVSYAWSLGDGTTATGATVNHTYGNAGSFTATVTATNDLGSLSASTQVVVTNAAPLADGGADQQVQPGAAVTLSGSGSDPDAHTPLSFSWRQTAGATVTLNCSSSGAVCGFTAPQLGGQPSLMLAFELIASDSRGQASLPDPVTVIVGAVTPTNLIVRAGPQIVAQQTNTFTATATGLDLSYSFDFGDGTPAVQDADGVVAYSYEQPGTYTLTVTASNAAGTTTKILQVVVVAKGESPSYSQRVRLPLMLRP